MFTKKLFDVANRESSNSKKYELDETWIKTSSNCLFSLWGLIVHLILLWGVLDVNFHSPIIKELPAITAPHGAPAKRVFLFVADGLRFQTFIDKPPLYLRNIMKNKGVWGISHTRVPTESRPGHVAIAAGLYEDPSAIFKGWQENPVDFDSVFNQSHSTWAWGSPDIIPIFTRGSKQNVHGKTYPSAWQDFDANLSNQTMRLDSWVFNAYLEWLHSTIADGIKDEKGIIFFFHLLGCDTLGHAKKPYSREYTENMNYVSQRIEEIVNVTERFFKNGTTAYVFTADHGMTDWGSHGSGLLSETETPLILWGAGIKKSGYRQDVEQASIAPLIASLIGIPIPVNNEGLLPWQYFDSNYHEYIGRALLGNVKQLAYQVTGNRAINCGNGGLLDWREDQLKDKIRKIEQLLDRGDVTEGIRKGDAAIIFAKEALSYFRQYQRIRFLTYLSIMWFAWITVLFLKIAGAERQYRRISLLLLTNIGFVSLLIITLVGHIVSDCGNWRLPCYASFAIISVWLAVNTLITSTPVFVVKNKRQLFIEIGGTLFLLMTLFFGLTYRLALSIGMLSTVLIRKIQSGNLQSPMFLWTSLALCVFPLLPVVEPYPRVYIVIISICLTISIVVLRETSRSRRIMEILRLVITGFVYTKFIDGRYLVSWIILLTTPLCIWQYPTEVKTRMLGITLGLFCPFALLSASYEPLFLLTLTGNLYCWLTAAPATPKYSKRSTLSTEDMIEAAFFMLYTLLCFFGTGNMASISSFDPSWTRHFVTVFSPFLMTSLILLKLSIPLILVGCANHALGTKSISLAVLFLGDCLSLPLMYSVTPYGSWLDIGSAISKFIIAISLPCLLLLLQRLSYLLMKIDSRLFQVSLVSQKTHIV
ncbi:GPI ethanolamine phosphate transferase 1 isoform X1 [Harpegnathos saltator]|uniref:GPI ethanolamine phosphate transferase 1 isoform X1 n=1 Tax=Harpegnathos saltator TaxID=610380 RepID=UPI00058DD71A|nr:GPI ethanolamine phosphate transferase 1 isoform X1 [Harpegnathos saltator]